ncbi:MAG TPA: ABC transporter ATP-binding protein [Gemmatimonadales bacterium]|jgi:ABC-type multidrug transport system ATPase subunit|nr:ABC transporter ATP-binding protein [Gemmatimonadales bacterium]
MTEYALTLCDVAGRRVGGISLALLPGEITGVVGPAGAGKTTLLALAAGCVRPAHGDVRVFGLPLHDAAARRLVGYAPDSRMFPPVLTVREILMYYARLHWQPRALHGPRGLVREALELAGLGAVADSQVETLSRADIHRLNLAQAVLGGRRVLLLDEIFSGLDAIARRDLRGRIARLAADGIAVLITSRDPTALERLAARVIVLKDGRVVRAGSLGAVLGERVLEVILDAPPAEPPPGFRVTASGLEAPLAGRTVESALALCHAHRLAVRASRVRLRSLEEVVLETHDAR